LGAEQVPFSTVIAYLLQLLAVVTGNIGRDGGSIFAATLKPAVLSPKRFSEPQRALASGIQSIASQGGLGMFSPALIPEEILCDHPHRLRALIVEGANPWLSFSDTNAFRRARQELELLVVIDPAMTETALEADYVLPVPSGYEKWEWSDFVKGYPAIETQVRAPVVPVRGNCLPEPEIHVRLMEKLGLVPEPSTELVSAAADALTPAGAKVFLQLARQEAKGNSAADLAWTYRLVGPQLPAPGLVAVWQLCFANAATRREAVLNTLGQQWRDCDQYELGCELWRRIVDHPEGVEIARLDRTTNLADNLGWGDGKIRLLPEGIVSELRRAITSEPFSEPDYPLVLSAGVRTRHTANTIQRDPAWRKGKGSKCTLHMSAADLADYGLEDGDRVRVATVAGEVELPVEADKNLRPGFVWIPNGYGMWKPGTEPHSGDLDGVNINELTDAKDRDPISGCPHHKHTLCLVEKLN
jgi:anaerobic selenocysteine-containing dehydrogenase